jgi:exoribonuclease II
MEHRSIHHCCVDHTGMTDELRKDWQAYSAFVLQEMITGKEDKFLPVWLKMINEDLQKISRDAKYLNRDSAVETNE